MNTRVSILLAFAIFISGCDGNLEALKPKPGLYDSMPLGVARVVGECKGKIAITPSQIGDLEISYPLVYHCDSKKFEVLKVKEKYYGFGYGDLTIGRDGYYLHEFRTIDLTRTGGYSFYDLEGNFLSRFERPDFDAHDLIVSDASITYMAYVPERNLNLCMGEKAPVELEIHEVDRGGKVLWSWASNGKIDLSKKVSKAEEINLSKESGWKKIVRPFRSCYTSLLLQVFDFYTPRWNVLPGRWPIFQLDLNDYIHANSLQYLPELNSILVSARHLDAIFLIDKKSGDITWSLGGVHSKFTDNRPISDRRNGFSHQHSAAIHGEVLYVFDNANNYEKEISRVVGYRVNPDALSDATQIFEITEPNNKKRPAMGHVHPIGEHELLVGWGAILERDRASPQRAVSIYDLKTRNESFYIDFLPGWISYRAKHTSIP